MKNKKVVKISLSDYDNHLHGLFELDYLKIVNRRFKLNRQEKMPYIRAILFF